MTAIPNSIAPVNAPVTNSASALKGIASSAASGAHTNAPSASFLHVIAHFHKAAQTAGASQGASVGTASESKATGLNTDSKKTAAPATPAAQNNASNAPVVAQPQPPVPLPAVPPPAPPIKQDADSKADSKPDSDTKQQNANGDNSNDTTAHTTQTSSPQVVIPVIVPVVTLPATAAAKSPAARIVQTSGGAIAPVKNAVSKQAPPTGQNDSVETDADATDNVDVPPATPAADAKSGDSNDNTPSHDDRPAFTLAPATALVVNEDTPPVQTPPTSHNTTASTAQAANPPIDFTAATAQPQVWAPQSTATFQQSIAFTTTTLDTSHPVETSTNGNAAVHTAASAAAQDAATPMIENARFIQAPGRSEMHVGINTDSLGTVNVHAIMRTDAGNTGSVAASITVQSHETQALLAKELPALQGRLEQHNVHVGEISVIPESLSAGTGMMQDQHAPQQQQQSYSRQPQSNAYMSDSPGGNGANNAAESSAPAWTVADGRLSVMA